MLLAARVPLRDVLELAQIGKDGHGFNKSTDLAVVVKTPRAAK